MSDQNRPVAPPQPPPVPDFSSLPAEPRPWGPWWSILWGFVVICVWQIAQIATLMVLSLLEQGPAGLSGEALNSFMENAMQDGDAVGLMSFFSALVACAMIVAIVKVRGISLAEGLALRAPRHWWMWLLVPPFWFAGVTLIGLLVENFQSDKSALDQEQIAGMVAGADFLGYLLLGVAVGAPLFEEFLFRGLLHEGLRQTVIGRWGAMVLTALVFSLMHAQYQDPAAFVMLFFLGCLFTLARELSGSLWIAVALHALQNAMVTTMMFLVLNGHIPESQLPDEMKQMLEDMEKSTPAEVSSETL
ncbi:CPBP family intramembrane glutamic endopeptidase [Roseibacillus ishigakijimensis]|uniref:CPBP family intramembrane metalloprotease n=1 Tax=Roseibacillus ishigakijimensis TaxID=454146 RepID=A0A934VLZ2_9BACT|nr:type II CAAX endopeptidase family protein [Roseibacillus ishigakijimensis]MBK1835189.1 CPBP family intramembrane metalloprotease [Roseibacillus ishigakijimensis]